MMHPPSGPDAEKESFINQAPNRNTVEMVYPLSVIKEVAATYPKTKVPAFLREWGTDRREEFFDEAFDDAISSMDQDKAPGVFWETLGTTNGIVCSTHYDTLRAEVYRLATMMIEEDLSYCSAEDLLCKTGIVYKLFVKGELHTREKILSKRQRLIFSSPLAMTLLERMWFAKQNQAEIALANQGGNILSRPGTPFTHQGALDLEKQVEDFDCESIVSTDQKGWDTRVTGWLMDADIERRAQLLIGDIESISRWRRGAANLNCIVKLKTVSFSDGHMVSQTAEGWWPSGSYRTSGTNSAMRVLIRRLAVGDLNAITMGDDACEGQHPNLTQLYAEYGFVLKNATPVSSDDFEFCSKHFRNGVVVPVDTSVRKMVLNVCLHSTAEAKDSIKRELIDYPGLGELVQLGVLDHDPEALDQD